MSRSRKLDIDKVKLQSNHNRKMRRTNKIRINQGEEPLNDYDVIDYVSANSYTKLKRK